MAINQSGKGTEEREEREAREKGWEKEVQYNTIQ